MSDPALLLCAQDGVLELVLLKRHRRGNYEGGKTNAGSTCCGIRTRASAQPPVVEHPCPCPPHADSYWRAVVRDAPSRETLALQHPPTSYFFSPCEGLPRAQAPLRLSNRGG